MHDAYAIDTLTDSKCTPHRSNLRQLLGGRFELDIFVKSALSCAAAYAIKAVRAASPDDVIDEVGRIECQWQRE